MDVLHWCVALSSGKGLVLSKMAPYIFEDRVEQEVWPSECRRDFLDSADSLDSLDPSSPTSFFNRGSHPKGTSTAFANCLARRANNKMSLPVKAHASSSGPRNNSIAFGLELKFLVPLLAPAAADPEENILRDGKKVTNPVEPFRIPKEIGDNVDLIHKLARSTVAKVISGPPGCTAITSEDIATQSRKESDFWESKWIVKKANSPIPLGKQESLRGYTWVPIEISSPILHTDDELATYKPVEYIMSGLNKKLRVHVNASCDIHVHIGRMDGTPFPLSALKRLGMLLWMAEPILRTIRDPSSENYYNKHTWGAELRTYSRLAQAARSRNILGSIPSSSSAGNQPDGALLRQFLHLDNPNQPKIRAANPIDLAALQTIAQAGDHESLGRLLSGEGAQYRRLGFNFSAFGKEDKRAHTNPRTVEFRIMEATKRTDLVLSWLRICKAVTSTAIDDIEASRFTNVMVCLLREGDQYGLRGADGKVTTTFQSTNGKAVQQFRTLMNHLGLPEEAYKAFLTRVYNPPMSPQQTQG